MSLFKRWLIAVLVLTCMGQAQAAPAPLQLSVHNPGTEALFPVSSVIVSGARDAILIDAQFGASQAQALVQRLKASGKRLTTIYISHGDPDYYFGLQTLTQAFPQAKVLASAPTVAHIKATMDAKLSFWGPQMGADRPTALVVPQVLKGNHLELEGRRLEVIGLDGAQPDRSFVWIPSLQAVVGGVVVAEHLHVWMADTQGKAAQQAWLATLDRIEALRPKVVVPGHYLGNSDYTVEAVRFTRSYVQAFMAQSAEAKDSKQLIEAMQARFPQLGEVSSLELSAKVATGEMQW